LAEQPTSPRPKPPLPSSGGSSQPGSPGGLPNLGNLPASAIVVIVIAVAILVWLLFIRGDGDSSEEDGAGGPQIEKTVNVVPASQLREELASVPYPVYWLGPRPGVDYEVTVISDGRTYVRYLPKEEEPETDNPYLTVGSYAQQNAFDGLEDLARESGEETTEIPNGGVALTKSDSPESTFVAFPGSDLQIEIYDPQAGRALELAESGDLSQVG